MGGNAASSHGQYFTVLHEYTFPLCLVGCDVGPSHYGVDSTLQQVDSLSFDLMFGI